jgi:sulfur-oxidizing protein SoxY
VVKTGWRNIGARRRAVLLHAAWAGLGLSGITQARAEDLPDNDEDLVRRKLAQPVSISPLVHLVMPAVFQNGYNVPLSLAVDSPMTDADHIRGVRVYAPKNPFILVAAYTFTPMSGRAMITTCIRLAAPQNVFAVAETNDSRLLMARTWVSVETNGCE